MEWMLDIQLGRRNLSPIQRIAVTEKYRPIYEKQALLNKQVAMQEARKNNDKNKFEQISVNLPKTDPINTSEKLANIAGVSEKTYRMGAKVLNSSNEDVKQRVLSGETSISAGYKELTQNQYIHKNQSSISLETKNMLNAFLIKEMICMFGLMRKSEHERICKNLHSHINHYAEGNRKYYDEIEEMKKQLELENRRATYWKMKYLEPDKEPIILGSKENVEYIKT